MYIYEETYTFFKKMNTLSTNEIKENPTPVALCVFAMSSLLNKVGENVTGMM